MDLGSIVCLSVGWALRAILSRLAKHSLSLAVSGMSCTTTSSDEWNRLVCSRSFSYCQFGCSDKERLGRPLKSMHKIQLAALAIGVAYGLLPHKQMARNHEAAGHFYSWAKRGRVPRKDMGMSWGNRTRRDFPRRSRRQPCPTARTRPVANLRRWKRRRSRHTGRPRRIPQHRGQ